MILFVCIRCVLLVFVVDKMCCCCCSSYCHWCYCCCLQQSIPIQTTVFQISNGSSVRFLVIWNKLFPNIRSRHWNRGNKSQNLKNSICHSTWKVEHDNKKEGRTRKKIWRPRATNVYIFNKHKQCLLYFLFHFDLMYATAVASERKRENDLLEVWAFILTDSIMLMFIELYIYI